MKGRLGCNGASLWDRCPTFRGCSDVSQRRTPIAQWRNAKSQREKTSITPPQKPQNSPVNGSFGNLKIANRSLTHYRIDINRDLNPYRLKFVFRLNTGSAPMKCHTFVFNSPQLSYTHIYVCIKHIVILATDVTCHAQILSC